MSTTDTTPIHWLNTVQAAAYLGMSERQVTRARQSGKLGHTRLGGNLVRHTQEQLDAYIEACTVAPAADSKSTVKAVR